MWNKDTKSKYKSSVKPSNAMPVTAGCFSDDATLWAFATGEDWSLGAHTASTRPNMINLYIRKCEKEDVFKPPKT